MNTKRRWQNWFILAIGMWSSLSPVSRARIEICPQNRAYWQYQGKPVMLLGGTDDDALFQWAGDMRLLLQQLELLKQHGGNYVRCTMSAREPDSLTCPPRAGPYMKLDNGKFDLDRWNDEYWQRLERFLAECQKRNIIAQIEIWATYDFVNVGPKALNSWPAHPLNPKNNINYGYSPETIFPKETRKAKNDEFYLTIPTIKNDSTVLKYQQAFVRKLLSHTLKYGNVLYCIDNEQRPQHPYQWGHYWAKYVQKYARKQGKTIHVSEMLRDFVTPKDKTLNRTKRMVGGKFAAVFDYPKIYSFLELSETSTRFSKYDELWKNADAIREYVSESPRPMTHVKIYGGGKLNKARGPRETIHRFCEFVCAGRSAVRFHRPVREGENGMGLNQTAQACIKAVRRFCDIIKPWECRPGIDLLLDREENEAYMLANPGVAYGVLLTGSFGDGSVKLNISKYPGAYKLDWINLETGHYGRGNRVHAGKTVTIKAPPKDSKYGWLATLVKE